MHIQRPLLLFSSWLSIPEDIFKSLPSCIFGYASHLFIDYVSLEIDFILAFSLSSTMKIEDIIGFGISLTCHISFFLVLMAKLEPSVHHDLVTCLLVVVLSYLYMLHLIVSFFTSWFFLCAIQLEHSLSIDASLYSHQPALSWFSDVELLSPLMCYLTFSTTWVLCITL